MVEFLTAQFPEDVFLFPNGHENAFVGVTERCGALPCAVFSSSVIIDNLKRENGMTEYEAVEFFDYNIKGAFVGEDIAFLTVPSED